MVLKKRTVALCGSALFVVIICDHMCSCFHFALRGYYTTKVAVNGLIIM